MPRLRQAFPSSSSRLLLLASSPRLPPASEHGCREQLTSRTRNQKHARTQRHTTRQRPQGADLFATLLLRFATSLAILLGGFGRVLLRLILLLAAFLLATLGRRCDAEGRFEPAPRKSVCVRAYVGSSVRRQEGDVGERKHRERERERERASERESERASAFSRPAD